MGATINDTGKQLIGYVNEALGQSVATVDDTGETLIGHVNDAFGVAGTATVNDTGERLIQHVNDALDHASPKTIRVMAYNVATFTVGTNSSTEQVDGNGYYSNGDPGYYIGGTIQRQGAYNERYAAWSDLLTSVNPDVFVGIEFNDNFAKVGGVGQTAASTILSNFTGYAEGVSLYRKAVFSRYGSFTHDSGIYVADQGIDNLRIYIIADIVVRGVTVRFALAHLTITRNITNNQDLTDRRTNEMKELINLCANYDHAVILGDFNVKTSDEYDLFKRAGYVCANHGEWGDLTTYNGTLAISNGTRALDNIIAKGFTISNVTVPDASVYHDINGVATKYPMSDHNPIWCDLTFV